jgi:hypothetical protein
VPKHLLGIDNGGTVAIVSTDSRAKEVVRRWRETGVGQRLFLVGVATPGICP